MHFKIKNMTISLMVTYKKIKNTSTTTTKRKPFERKSTQTTPVGNKINEAATPKRNSFMISSLQLKSHKEK